MRSTRRGCGCSSRNSRRGQATSYVSPLDFARAYAQLGEKALTFKYLDASFVDRSPGLVFLKVDRAWDAVRDDPRFLAAVQARRAAMMP